MDRSSNGNTQTSIFMTHQIHTAGPGAKITDLKKQKSHVLSGTPSWLPLEYTKERFITLDYYSTEVGDILWEKQNSDQPISLQFVKRQ